ncbi:MAG TPA: hypothetical protein O0X27_01980 [Methanocorpusculum sp.]|nr:hypothetical protein [Methanocorpusculum sp.]
MKGKVAICILLVLAFLCVPVSAATTYTLLPSETDDNSSLIPIISDGDNDYGYLKIQSVQYTLKNMDADIIVTYEIEPWLAFLVYLFGKDDLKTRVLGTLQYPESGYNQDITFQYLDTGRAVLHVTNAALDNQDNSYWFRAHNFGCTIPNLSFIFSDTDVKNFTNVKEMEKGIGYFRT